MNSLTSCVLFADRLTHALARLQRQPGTLAVLFVAADPIGNFMIGFFTVLPLRFGTLTRDLIVLVGGAGLGLGIIGSWVSVRTYLIR